MDYTTQIEIVIEIKTLLLKHVFAIYDNEDTTFENPAHKEMKSIKGYEIVYHDIDKLPHRLNDYQNLTFTIERKTCALINYTDAQRNEFYRWTNGCILPNSVKLCEFIDNKLFEENINFESKDKFQAILNDYFEEEHYKNRDLMRQLREVSASLPIPTPPHKAEETGYKSIYSDTQLENLYNNLIGNFLDGNTKLEHFKKAFNGELLGGDFEPLKWIEPTMGAVLFFHISKQKPQWRKYSYLFEPANYKQLLFQSKGNGTFENLNKTIL
jgi:hypothetical protein